MDVNEIQTYFAKTPVWNKVMKIEWTLHQEELEKFDTYKEIEFFLSPGFFHDSLDLFLDPDGLSDKVNHWDDDRSFGLDIYKLPKGIHHCDVKVHVSSNITDDYWGNVYQMEKEEENITFGDVIYFDPQSVSHLSLAMLENAIKEHGQVKFSITMNVVRIFAYGTDDAVIEERWPELGICE